MDSKPEGYRSTFISVPPYHPSITTPLTKITYQSELIQNYQYIISLNGNNLKPLMTAAPTGIIYTA